jgi:TolA-binding protein
MQRGQTSIALAAILLGLATPALAQVESREGIALQNEILELRQQMSQLQQFGSQAGPPPSNLPPPEQEGAAPYAPPGSGDAVAQLVVRVSAMEEQLRTLEGRISELENTQHRDHDDLAKQIGDLAFKTGHGAGAPEGTGTQGPDTLTPPTTGTVPSVGMDLTTQARPPAIPAHRAPELALKQGSAALARRDYAGAEAAAREVLALGRTTRFADANFLLARAQAGQHEYKDAAATFYGIYKANPRSPRGAESLLGVSNALIGLGDNTPACQALGKLAAEFPHPEASVRAGMASARKRASCQ